MQVVLSRLAGDRYEEAYVAFAKTFTGKDEALAAITKAGYAIVCCEEDSANPGCFDVFAAKPGAADIFTIEPKEG